MDSAAREYDVTAGDPEIERGEQEQMALNVQQENTALLMRPVRSAGVQSSGTSPPARAYLREPGDALDRWYDNCVKGGGDAEECAFLEKNLFKESVIRLPSGVQYSVIRNGTGASPGPSDTVLVNFRGMLLDGSEFYSSRKQGGAIHFRLDEAIPGLQAVLQYEEGAQWEVYIPSELAFRKPAPFGGQTVVFYLELIAITEAPRASESETGMAQAHARRALAAAHTDPEEQLADTGGVDWNESPTFAGPPGPPADEESPAANHRESTGDGTTRDAWAAREHVMSQPGLLLQMVGAQALTENGRFAGYRVTGTVDNDFLGRLDLAPGDLIVAVNGVPIDTPDHGLKALTSLSGTGPLSFTVIRDGRVEVLSQFSPP
ncbi:MAG: FKBP-type peptidyl-prolyl cis-trans isomerase [Gammaproteobacteria bacterium]